MFIANINNIVWLNWHKFGIDMKKYVFLCLFALLGIMHAYNNIGERSEEEMLVDADYAFKDFLFEAGIDSKNFKGPVIEDKQNGMKYYRWDGVFPENRIIGIEVSVAKQKSIVPEVGGIGKNDDWDAVFGTVQR